MAKKRTLKPFYGKINQRLEARASMLAKMGQHEEAKQLFEASEQIVKKKIHFRGAK